MNWKGLRVMKDKKFLFNLFDKDGNDYEVVVVGKKSASNLFDWIWEELKTEVMMRPLEDKNE